MASFLPQEMITRILSCLPVKSLIRFRCVCKDWFDLIKSPTFVQIHLQRAIENGNFNLISNHDDGRVYSIDCYDVVSPPYDEVEQITYPFYSPTVLKFLGSCNGLICLTVAKVPDPGKTYWFEMTCIWNPATKESMEIPYDYYPSSYGYPEEETSGFGYDYRTQDYKVVTIVNHYKENSYHLTVVNVYTLGSNSWRRIGDIPYVLACIGSPGICVNGALHWVAKRSNKTQVSSDEEELPSDEELLIISLDLGDEEYRELLQPEYSDDNLIMNLGVLEGCLCVIRSDTGKTQFDLWMMKEYGVRESWNKLLTIRQAMSTDEQLVRLTPIKILKNGGILLNSCGLMLYDPTNKRVRQLDIPENVHGLPLFDAVAYVGSLIPLNSDKFCWPRGVNGASRT